MNTATHRTIKPLPLSAAAAWQRLGRVVMQSRASLEGLEVKDSSFDEWLAAGGDRRSRSRVDASDSSLTIKAGLQGRK